MIWLKLLDDWNYFGEGPLGTAESALNRIPLRSLMNTIVNLHFKKMLHHFDCAIDRGYESFIGFYLYQFFR